MRPFLALINWHLAIVWVTLATHVLVCGGVPVWVAARPAVFRSAPYPCQGHCCGCSSAHHCWTECRCMSMAEKLQWAKRNGVTPPAYVRQPVKDCCAARELCCSAPAAEHRVHRLKQDPVLRPSACCATGNRELHRPSSDSEALSESSSEQGRWMLTVQAQKCQGLTLQWCASGVTIPVPPIAQRPQAIFLGEYVAIPENHYVAVSSVPDSPPPRCASI